MFFWHAKQIPTQNDWNMNEPLRVVIITNPKKFLYHVYYNQATSRNDNKLKLVNWFDCNNLGLNKEPLLPDVKEIYKNFYDRTFIVPIIHVSYAHIYSVTFREIYLCKYVKHILPRLEPTVDFPELHQKFHKQFSKFI